MINTNKTRSLIALSICIAAMSPYAAFAKDPSPQEKALLAASATAPLKFTIPISQEAAVMGQAQVVITRWSDIDSSCKALDVRIATNNLIRPEKQDSAVWHPVGFTVIAANSGNRADVTVSAEAARDQDANSGSHLLAYELEQYAATLPADAAVSSAPSLPDDVAVDVKLFTTQVAAGDYSTALTTVDTLKGAVLTAQKRAATK